MEGFAESYLGRDKKESEGAQYQADLILAKHEAQEHLLDSTGMPRWLAKIVFAAKVDIIWEAEDKQELGAST